MYLREDGANVVIPRSELNPEIDQAIYEELKKESNNNEVELNKHRVFFEYDLSDNRIIDRFVEKKDTYDEVIKIMQSQQIKKAIDSLLPREKKLIYKKFCEDKTNTQIANEQDVSESLIRKNLRKINKKLQIK